MFVWDDLKHFLVFARTGSVLVAAKALRVNQSTVQRRLTGLEERLRCRLVVRDLTGYRLTELGEEMRPAAERVEQAVTAFEGELAARDQGLSGLIRVTTVALVADRLRRTPLIDAFHDRHPNLRLELVISDRVLDLSLGEADLAIRAGEPKDEALVGRKIADVPWAVYASRSYIERHGAPESAEDINRHFVVACCESADCSAARWLRSVAPHATVAAYCDTGLEQVLAVKSGVGLAPLLTYHEESSELVRVIDKINIETPFYLLMHRDMQHTPRVRAFADFVASEIKPFRALILG